MRTALRKTRREERERAGLAAQPCVLCIEQHHTAGRNHDEQLTAPVCQKHHRELHETMLQQNISLSFEPNPKSRVAKGLRAMAIYQREEAAAMERMADLLDLERGTDEIQQ
jgi:hypothetical protein